MLTVNLLVFLVVILIVGIFKIINRLTIWKYRLGFTQEYLATFRKFTGKEDNKPYIDYYPWLMGRVDQMQAYLGDYGLFVYTPPLANYRIKNYQMLLNTLPKINQGTVPPNDIDFCIDSLLRFIGGLENEVNLEKKNIINPLIWFVEGVQTIILLPFYFLEKSKIISENTYKDIQGSSIIRVLVSICSFLGFIASIITLVVDGGNFLQVIENILH